jgi:hypothetical protein
MVVGPPDAEITSTAVIDAFPLVSEVVLNLDLTGLLRHAGRAHNGEVPIRERVIARFDRR